MPTPAKLVAALAMATVGWASAEALILFALSDGQSPGRLREVAALLGLVLGWRQLGRAATGPRGKGDRMMEAMVAGLGTALTMALSAVALHAAYATIGGAVARPPGGIGPAVETLIDQIVVNAMLLTEPRVPAVLSGGGALAGLVAGVTGRVWW